MSPWNYDGRKDIILVSSAMAALSIDRWSEGGARPGSPDGVKIRNPSGLIMLQVVVECPRRSGHRNALMPDILSVR
jgi:hypothetical protein